MFITEKTYVAPLDHNLSQYVNDVIKNIEPIPSYKEQVVALAQLVYYIFLNS